MVSIIKQIPKGTRKQLLTEFHFAVYHKVVDIKLRFEFQGKSKNETKEMRT